MANVTWYATDLNQPPLPHTAPRPLSMLRRILRHFGLLGFTLVAVMGSLFILGVLLPIGLMELGIDTGVGEYDMPLWFHLPFAPIDTIYEYVTSETPLIGQGGPDFGINLKIGFMYFLSNAIAWTVLIYLGVLVWHVFRRRSSIQKEAPIPR